MYRRPKTRAARRASQQRDNYQIVDDYRVQTRAKRNMKNIRSDWDDILSPWNVKSWKRYRMNQWKQIRTEGQAD